MQYVCKECKKTAPMEWVTCGTCGEDGGVTGIPEDWRYWPQPHNQTSWPKPLICGECIDEDEYQKALFEVRKNDDSGKCPECNTRK